MDGISEVHKCAALQHHAEESVGKRSARLVHLPCDAHCTLHIVHRPSSNAIPGARLVCIAAAALVQPDKEVRGVGGVRG